MPNRSYICFIKSGGISALRSVRGENIMKNNAVHLNENQLIRSVIAENDLSLAARNHLLTCPVCQEKKQQFEKELDRLGFMAKACVPMFRKKIPIFSQKKNRRLFRQIAVAGFATLILLTVGIFRDPLFKDSQENQMSQSQLIKEMEEDRKLMTEIHALEENPLPDFYMDISVESYGDMNDEFMEFVVPSKENQTEENGNREGPFGWYSQSFSAV